MSDTVKLVATIVGTGVAVCGVIGFNILGMRSNVDAFQAEAADDRRAHQAAMDSFRTEMLSLSERQARVEGQVSLLATDEAATRNLQGRSP